MKNSDYQAMLASMCREWIRATDYAANMGWTEERAVAAMLVMLERGDAFFECQKVGTMAFQTGHHTAVRSH